MNGLVTGSLGCGLQTPMIPHQFIRSSQNKDKLISFSLWDKIRCFSSVGTAVLIARQWLQPQPSSITGEQACRINKRLHQGKLNKFSALSPTLMSGRMCLTCDGAELLSGGSWRVRKWQTDRHSSQQPHSFNLKGLLTRWRDFGFTYLCKRCFETGYILLRSCNHIMDSLLHLTWNQLWIVFHLCSLNHEFSWVFIGFVWLSIHNLYRS